MSISVNHDEQPIQSTNEQLKHYVHQMESEVGQSGRTLHQVFSEYLKLKTENPDLTQELEGLELLNIESLTLEQFKQNCDVIRRTQTLRDQVLPGSLPPDKHPWHGFAHPDHCPDDFEALIRTLRFVAIQLSKFWVEVQSFPLFLNTLENISVGEIEEIFQWLKSSPSWHEMIPQPRLIPVLTHPESRKSLLEFVRDVKSARALCDKAASYQDSAYLTSDAIQSGFCLLTEGVHLTQKHLLDRSNRSELDAHVANHQKELDQIHQLQRFFEGLSGLTGLPLPSHPEEAKKIFQLKNSIAAIPKTILPWRQPQILASSQLVRIQALQDRARPILESRKRLEAHFKLNSPIEADFLRKLGAIFTEGGVLRRFKTPYQDAIQNYKNLLQPDALLQGALKETSFQMAERLNEWATYIEHLQTFNKNEDVRKTFGVFFKGIETDFVMAAATNRWASELRTSFAVEESPFSSSLVEFMFKSSEEKLDQVVHYLESGEALPVENFINQAVPLANSTYMNLESNTHGTVTELRRLAAVTAHLGVKPELLLSSLKELQQTHEEIIFLIGQIDSRSELKEWLKGHYRGIDTDLSLIKNSSAFVHYIERSTILSSMKNSFLTPHGPQRFGETRALAISALASLEGLKELFQKLEIVTRGQARAAINRPIPKLLNSIQQALKQPSLLNDWVTYLQCEREAKELGLASFLDFFEIKGLVNRPLVTAYDLAFHAALLKQAIEQSAASSKEGTAPSTFH